MNMLITTDIHLNDKPLDAHRWELLPWLKTQARKLGTSDILFLGDITDAKDRHSATLVNRFIDQVSELRQESILHFLKGNHDYIDESNPFFGFVRSMDDVRFHTIPTEITIMGGHETLFLPNTKDYQNDWEPFLFDDYEYIFCHQTFEGALAANGYPLPGIPPTVFGDTEAKIYSGDIHSPGMVGAIEYVGSPYRTHFGDKYRPRVVYIDHYGDATDLFFPCPSRHVIDVYTLRDLDSKKLKDIYEGDQVKVRVHIERPDFSTYPKFREEIAAKLDERKWVNCGIEVAEIAIKKQEGQTTPSEYRTPEQLVRAYAEDNKLTREQEELGVSLLG